MLIRADRSVPALVRFAETPWVSSPERGVERKLLERIGGEVARATSIVRYAAGSSFSPHVHDLGEEIFVLEGVFSDEHGDYEAGSYLRNPPGSSHAPFSRNGCTIFVKLRQFAADDHAHVLSHAALTSPAAQLLHAHRGERVELVRVTSPTRFSAEGTMELLVVEGDARIDGIAAPRWTWARRSARMVEVTPMGEATLWLKATSR